MYSTPSLRVELFGGGKPASRPQNWQLITVPGICSSTIGDPPSAPTAKAFMSIEYTPLQSLAGSGVPPELTAGVRWIGGFTHRVPPWNGVVLRPWVPYSRSPLFRFLTLIASTVNPDPAVALGKPLPPIEGRHPIELTFAASTATS